ncbi:MAG: DUF192 domain-containing protein [Chloroflexi bacterium]|nr:DUF192 domain-containing protein [Chloroflexota bacterium]
MFQITPYLIIELTVLAGFGTGFAVFYWIRARRRRRAAAFVPGQGPPPLREVIDRKRPTTTAMLPIPEKSRATLREAIFSRRRLRALLLVAAAFVLLGGFGIAYYLNSDYRNQTFAKKTVSRMASAPSYRAVGRDTESDAGGVRDVREQFVYNAPDSVRTRYLTTESRPGMGTAAVECADKEIVVIGSTRYQRCNDAESSQQSWRTDSFNPAILRTELFQPWIRFLWCIKVGEQDLSEEIMGVPNQVFTCRVRNEQEAATVWATRPGEAKLSDKSQAARERFLREAVVDISIWVRETDGYIGRFAMTKTAPGSLGPRTETVDYVYSDFGAVPTVGAPSDEEAKQGGSQTVQPQVSLRYALINGQRFNLEMADDDAKRMTGLSKRAIVPENSAMLFVFPQEDIYRFWMKDVMVPLDAVFLDRSGRIVDIITMPTQPGVPDSQLRVYEPAAPATYAMEINAGLAERYGMEVGQTVQLQ